MGFCNDDQIEEFFRTVPEFERCCARSGIQLIKYWFSITDEEQHSRFLGRIHDPLKQWKLSPMDLESRVRWEDYTKAKEVMLERTHIPEAPVVGGAGRGQEEGPAQSASHHLLEQMPYHEVEQETVQLPRRARAPRRRHAPPRSARRWWCPSATEPIVKTTADHAACPPTQGHIDFLIDFPNGIPF